MYTSYSSVILLLLQFRVLLFCEADLQQAVSWCNERLHDDQGDLQKKIKEVVILLAIGLP